MSLPELMSKTLSTSERLGPLVQSLMERTIQPAKLRVDPVVEAWSRSVPPALAAHCHVAGMSGGQLRVKVDSPVYLYEIQLCQDALLKELQTQVPRAGLRKIRFQLG